MGREIRRVPRGWQHPKKDGDYLPMRDRSYEDARREWLEELKYWLDGTHPDYNPKYDYWEWAGDPPKRKYYHPAWRAEEANCYQIYENVSEGTPVSPIFESLEQLADWLVSEGVSRKAADAFAKDGYVPSMVIANGKITMTYETAGLDLKS